MFIKKVISYGNAWNNLMENHASELEEIKAALARLTKENIEESPPIRELPHQHVPGGITPFRFEGCWDNAIRAYGWRESRHAIENLGGRPIYMRGLGYIKNRISASLQRNREILNRWLYTLAPLAIRNGHIDIPIAITTLIEAEESLFGKRSIVRAGFERIQDELLALSPLSHGNQFLLLGLSLVEEPLEIINLESEGEVQSRQIIINRSIEFPPEYHQAGIGILSYFGSVLREKYPNHDATVKIEQNGLNVRLIIESKNGGREIIEKALYEYQLVVRGKAAPETFFESNAKVLELKNELRIAQVRIESQRDLIEYQGAELSTFKQLMCQALSGEARHPAITISPTIIVSNTQANNFLLQNSIPLVAEHLEELASRVTGDPSLELRLRDMEEAFTAMGDKKTEGEIMRSTGMQKLKRFLDEASNTGSAVHQFLGKLDDGISILQRLARNYNDIAAWCGAPQVPQVLLGNARKV